MRSTELAPRRAKFVTEYVETGNATQATTRAYFRSAPLVHNLPVMICLTRDFGLTLARVRDNKPSAVPVLADDQLVHEVHRVDKVQQKQKYS